MATVHITLTDTPAGGVSIHTSFQPAVGKICTAAQSAAMEIVNRTSKQWGVEPSYKPLPTTCRCYLRPGEDMVNSTVCSACGKAVQP